MDCIVSNDPFFTPEVVEYMRHKNLDNISLEESMEVLQAIVDVYSLRPKVRYEWAEVSNAHEAEAVYFSRKELKARRQMAAKLVAADTCATTLNRVFAILSHKDRGFKEEYLENEAQALRNCPTLVEKLREDFFVTGYYPGRDQGPQTEEEWDELQAEVNAEDCVSDEEVRRMCKEWLSCA